MNTHPPRALIAEDEPLLATALQQALAQAWPALQIVATAGDGLSAVQLALALRPEVMFFDIRMPGQSGLDAAAELADAWPTGQPFPALVFVTAYDHYAVQAFEAQAVDYLLKPVQAARLQKTVQKLQQTLASQAPAIVNFETTLAQLRQLLNAPGLQDSSAAARRATPLTLIAASRGTQVHMVPVSEVQYFEATDKYVRVLTVGHEYLVRMPLKELAAMLPTQQFWQIHRSTLVRASAIASVERDAAGRLQLALRGRPEPLAVSRLYAHLFKAM